MNLQVAFWITPGIWKAMLLFVALHCAQLLLEESVLGLDILGRVFAITSKQSPSELCLAVIADPTWLLTLSGHSPWDHIVWKSNFSGVCEKQPSQAVSLAGQGLTCSLISQLLFARPLPPWRVWLFWPSLALLKAG